MAEIPVEKKSSTSWIWWLLLILGILALLWWLFSSDDDEQARYVVNEHDTVMAVEGDSDMAAAGAITSLAMLRADSQLVGREVRLDGVAVNEVVGDEGFTIGEGANETLVMFDEVRTPDTAMEGQVDVNPGSRVSIEGMVEAYEGNVPTSVSREIADNTQMLVRASNVTVQN